MKDTKAIPLIDILVYIFIPGPMILLYPLLVATMLQGSIESPLGKFALLGTSGIVNLIILPFLIPISFIIGFILSSILIPVLLSLYGLSLANRIMGDGFSLSKYVDVLNSYIPKFDAECDDNALTEDCLTEDYITEDHVD